MNKTTKIKQKKIIRDEMDEETMELELKDLQNYRIELNGGYDL